MSKLVILEVKISDKVYELMHGGKTSENDNGIPVFQINACASDDSKTFIPAIDLMLISEAQRDASKIIHPELFTTKEQ